MKFGATILSFPKQELNNDIADKFDSVETTAMKLKENDSNKVKVDTMLSLIDLSLSKYQDKDTEDLSIMNMSIIKSIASNIAEGTEKGISNFVYGSPKTREACEDNESIVRGMLQIAYELRYKTSKEVTIYIEPIQHHKRVAHTYKDVIRIVEKINEVNDNELVTFKPLFDLGNEILISEDEEVGMTSPIEIATTTDRMHVRVANPVYEINNLTSSQQDYVQQIVSINQNMTLSYEHINLDENESILDFCKMFKQFKTTRDYDVIVIGSGMYGLYCARKLLEKGLKVAIITQDDMRNSDRSSSSVASIVNQARVHNGYHYPRSIATALDSVKHYQEFVDDFNEAIIDDFKQIYAIPRYGSATSASQFKQFCDTIGIQCDYYSDDYMRLNQLQGSFLANEVAIDTSKMIEIALQKASSADYYVDSIRKIYEHKGRLKVLTSSEAKITASYIINATYSHINKVIDKVSKYIFDPQENHVNIKYQACEMALFRPKDQSVYQRGYTFMDGPFISIMPHTQDGLVSMSSVIYTPHITSYDDITDLKLKSRKDFMLNEARQFLSDEYLDQLEYVESRYVIKALPQNVESSDNRLVSIYKTGKKFTSILSGKLNAIYELDTFLDEVYNKCLLKQQID